MLDKNIFKKTFGKVFVYNQQRILLITKKNILKLGGDRELYKIVVDILMKIFISKKYTHIKISKKYFRKLFLKYKFNNFL